MAQYIILILCVVISDPDELRICHSLFNLAYMDNFGFSSSNEDEVVQVYELSNNIFSDYKFSLQQYATKCSKLKSYFVEESDKTGLFGLVWSKRSDTYSVCNRTLEITANTKRLVLKSLNSIFGPLGNMLPTLIRTKLILHEVQAKKELGWDTKFDKVLQKKWSNIDKRVNSSAALTIPRYVGDYSSSYKLLVFTDAIM